MEKPVLVSGTDGVGTKLKLAFLMDKHDTIGIDCVAMCVNDVLCSGAQPLFFLDYVAVGKNVPERVAQIVAGVAEGCVQAGCALIGGETAEMPGFYAADEYDLAGFCVGLVDEKNILSKDNVQPGDVLLALPSTGLHSNGFSLARKALDVEHADLHTPRADLNGQSLGEALLAPTAIYVKPVLALLKDMPVNGIAHITGGGFYENIPRCLPDGLTALVNRKSVKVPPIFDVLAQAGDISQHEMYATFNMGVGMVLVVKKDLAARAVEVLLREGQPAYVLGGVVTGSEGVRFADA
jgi:phosphoribosylformylglycinamidine cyclo-ligase